MDTSYTYSSDKGQRVMLYVPPEFGPPDAFPMMEGAEKVWFKRLSDRSLTCGQIPGVSGDCRSTDCHRRVLGECQCGRHQSPVRFEKAVR